MSQIEPARIIEGHAMQIVGSDKHYEFANMGDIPKQWMAFAPHLNSIPGRTEMVAYGISHKMEASGCNYLCGVEITEGSPISEGFVSLALPAQKYAVFTHADHMSRLSETIDGIWRLWFPSSGYQLVAYPVMMERYGPTFDPAVGIGDIEVWFPIS